MSVTFIKEYNNQLPVWCVFVSGTLVCKVTKLTDAIRLRDRLVAAYVGTVESAA